MILQEIAATRDSPDEIAYELLQDAAFPDAGHRPADPRHRRERRRASAPTTCARFLKANYGAKRMVLSAAGNVDHAELVRHAEAQFGGLNGGDGEPIRAGALCRWHAHVGQAVRAEPSRHGVRRAVVSRPGVLYGPGIFRAVRRGMSSRLFQEVRERRGLCYAIYSSCWALADTGLFGIHAATGPEMMEKLIDVVGEQLLRAAAEKPAEAELARSKAQIKAGLLMGLESSSARAEQMARQLLLFDRLIEHARADRAHRRRDGGSGARAGGASCVSGSQPVGRRRRRRTQGRRRFAAHGGGARARDGGVSALSGEFEGTRWPS